MMSATIEIRRVGVEKILDLRHRILRAGLPPESARFEGDEAETTLHLAAFMVESSDPATNGAVGCLSLMLNSFQSEPAWQLRGMAVDEAQQRSGLGRKLLTHAEEAVASASTVGLLWCNARVPASGFYQKQGWTIVSEVFEIATAGPHVKMSKRVKGANSRETVEKPSGKG
jgi:GNAT superfamily N-acetyltransferase